MILNVNVMYNFGQLFSKKKTEGNEEIIIVINRLLQFVNKLIAKLKNKNLLRMRFETRTVIY